MDLDEPSTVPGFKVQFDLEGFSLRNLWCCLHVGDPQTLQRHHDMTMACSDLSRDHVYSWMRCCQQSWIPGSRTRARNVAVSMIHLWPGRARVLLQLAPIFFNLHLEKQRSLPHPHCTARVHVARDQSMQSRHVHNTLGWRGCEITDLFFQRFH